MLIIKHGALANYRSIMHIIKLWSNREFTKAQVKLTRAQAQVGPGVDTPLTITR